MNSRATPSFEKERQAYKPGAKLGINNGAAENPLRTNHRSEFVQTSFGKNAGSFASQNRGTIPAQASGTFPVGYPNTSSELPPLGRNDLIEAWQSIILRFPTKQVAEEQDATTRAVESQRNGDSAASLLAAINQARANPRVRAELGRLMGFTGCYTDPDFMQAMELIGQRYMREQFALIGAAPQEYTVSEITAVDDSPNCAGEDHDDLTGDLFQTWGSA